MKKLHFLLGLTWFFTICLNAQYTGGIGSGYDMASTGQKFMLSFVIEGNGEVVVKVASEVIDPDPAGSNNYLLDEGTEVTITAEPDPGWVFGHWTGDAVPLGEEGITEITITIDEATPITAKFLKPLIITVNPGSRIYGETDGDYSFADFSAQLILGDVIADVTGGSGGPEDVDYIFETTVFNSNVGTYLNEIGIDLASINGPKANDYYVEEIIRGELTINKRELTLSIFVADGKTYDGTTDVLSGDGFDDDRILGDILDFDYDVTFEDKHAGIDKNVDFTNIVVSGGDDMDNYTLITAAGVATATITTRGLTLSNFVADSKPYDGNTDVLSGDGFDDDRIPGDILEFDFAVAFEDEAVGVDKNVDFTDIVIIGGDDMDNYNLLTTNGSATATITRKTLTIGGSFEAHNKIYDETTAATIKNDNLTLIGKVNDEDVFLDAVVVNFDHTGPGNNIRVTITSAGIDGTHKDNYELDYITGAPVAFAKIFAPEVTLTLNIEGNGSVLIGGTLYSAGQQSITLHKDTLYSIEATGSAGWEFSQWVGGVYDEDEAGTEILMDNDKEITVHFVESEYRINIIVVGDGSVDKDPDETFYYYNDVVNITATPDAGWLFKGWSGDLTGSLSPATLLIDEDKEVTATFVEEVTLSISLEGEGGVVVKKGQQELTADNGNYKVAVDTELTVTAIAEEDWSFSGWAGDDADDLESNTLASTKITMDRNKSIQAVFGLANIVESLELGKIRLYPNPAKNNINLEIEKSDELLAVEIINSHGQVVVNKAFENHTGKIVETIDLTNLDGGMYYVRIVTKRGTLSNKIIVR